MWTQYKSLSSQKKKGGGLNSQKLFLLGPHVGKSGQFSFWKRFWYLSITDSKIPLDLIPSGNQDMDIDSRVVEGIRSISILERRYSQNQ